MTHDAETTSVSDPRPGMTPEPRQRYRFFDAIMVAFVVALLCSNIIGAVKVSQVGGVTFGAAIFFFPITYLFGDILTEVYGYARSRRVIWAGFGAMIFASLMALFVGALPPAPGWEQQAAFDAMFGMTPRITLASLVAFWAGELCNSYVMAKMKIWTAGKHLWARTIGSTVVGEAVDSAIFYPLAFLGPWPWELVLQVMIFNYIIKVLWEVLATPLTYRIVGYLKRVEREDYYDTDTDFSPFRVGVR